MECIHSCQKQNVLQMDVILVKENQRQNVSNDFTSNVTPSRESTKHNMDVITGRYRFLSHFTILIYYIISMGTLQINFFRINFY